MPGYALRFRLLPIAAALCVGSCLSTEGYYRYQDGGTPGTAGTSGTAGATATAGTMGNGGSAAGTGGSATGTAGTTGSAGRGGTTGSAGRGGTTGSAGRGGTTGTAGATGNVLFMDDFESGTSKWDLALNLTHSLTSDGSQVLDMGETAGDQALAAAPLSQPNWTNISVEARVKVVQFTGTSTSDVAAICARLTGPTQFYYFAIQSDGKAKIKIQNNGNSSIGSSIDFSFQPNTWYTMKLQIVGTSLTGYINGAMVGATVTDSNIASGGIGLMVQRTHAEFDDVVVRSAP
jgi:hypothetical protein